MTRKTLPPSWAAVPVVKTGTISAKTATIAASFTQ